MYIRPSPWTPENISKLQEFRNEGLSAKQIAEKLGTQFTRNAVIGKCHRLGIRLRSTRSSFSASVREGVRTYRRQKQRSIAARSVLFRKYYKPVETPIEELTPQTAVTFANLEDHQCKFPYGEGLNMKFCGANAERGSYCTYHHHKCYIGEPT